MPGQKRLWRTLPAAASPLGRAAADASGALGRGSGPRGRGAAAAGNAGGMRPGTATGRGGGSDWVEGKPEGTLA